MRDDDYFRFRVGEDRRQSDWFKTAIKLLALVVVVIFIVFIGVWGYKNIISNDTTTTQAVRQKIVTNPQKGRLTQAEIALIVKTVIQEMQKQQQHDIEVAMKNKTIKKSEDSELLSSLQNVNPENSNTKQKTNEDLQKLANKKIEKPKDEIIRKKIVYNAVIINKKEIKTPDDLAKLYASINKISRSKKRKILKSAYTKKIQKEIIIRKNAMRTIVVQAGDTLSSIAQRAYGKSSMYKKILDANPDILTNPHRLKIGMRLRVPK